MNLEAHDIAARIADAGELDFRSLGDFNGGGAGVFRSGVGVSPWEMHPDGDEFLHLISGVVDVEVLSARSRKIVQLNAGSAVVVPRGHWHRHIVKSPAVEIYVTPGRSLHSEADDPRDARA